MPVFSAEQLERLAAGVFERAGASADDARHVARHLVDANLAGHDSHGVLRIPQYVELIDAGKLRPGGQMRIVRQTAAIAVVDGNGGFGQVIARDAMWLAIEKARAGGIGAVTVRNCCHTGRLGAYSEMAAAAGLVGIVVANAGGGGQLVAPFGGTQRRLSTNPISIAAPSDEPHAIVLDMASSVAPEGKVRAALQAKKSVPNGWLIDARGEPTTNPADFYADPAGSILPLGAAAGHKGFVLSFLIDILAGALTEAGCCEPDRAYPGDGMLSLALDVEQFTPLADFRQRVSQLEAYVKSCPTAAGVERIHVPGEVERRKREDRLRDGITVEPGTWQLVESVCRRFGVEI